MEEEYAVDNIGFAAYLMMKEYMIKEYRDGKCIFLGKHDNFEKEYTNYLNSQFSRFDSFVIITKKNITGSRRVSGS
jgi:hypothetical protein